MMGEGTQTLSDQAEYYRMLQRHVLADRKLNGLFDAFVMHMSK
jgi:hypothetical protein